MKLSLLFLTLCVAWGSVGSGLNICQTTPTWRLSGTTFPRDYVGRLKVVALLRATCGFCQIQASRLAELEKELISRGKKGINFVIVNPAEKADFLKLDEFRNRTSVPIIQDTEALKLWDIYQGTTDDIFIFDKCGRLVIKLSLPDSNIREGKVKSEILKAYDKPPCSEKCRPRRRNQ